MKDWKIGDDVEIGDELSPYYKKRGRVTNLGVTGGLYILLEGEKEEIYFPFGYDIIR